MSGCTRLSRTRMCSERNKFISSVRTFERAGVLVRRSLFSDVHRLSNVDAYFVQLKVSPVQSCTLCICEIIGRLTARFLCESMSAQTRILDCIFGSDEITSVSILFGGTEGIQHSGWSNKALSKLCKPFRSHIPLSVRDVELSSQNP